MDFWADIIYNEEEMVLQGATFTIDDFHGSRIKSTGESKYYFFNVLINIHRST